MRMLVFWFGGRGGEGGEILLRAPVRVRAEVQYSTVRFSGHAFFDVGAGFCSGLCI